MLLKSMTVRSHSSWSGIWNMVLMGKDENWIFSLLWKHENKSCILLFCMSHSQPRHSNNHEGMCHRHWLHIPFFDQELIPYHCSSCFFCSCWGNLFKNAQCPVISNQATMKFSRIVFQVKYASIDRVQFLIWHHTFQASSHDIISHRKVLPSGDCTCSVCHVHIQHHLSVPDP